MTSSVIPKYDVIIVIFMSRQLRKWKFVIVSFVFGWIQLNFGVRGNFRFLISNLNSKMQYLFTILRKCHFSSLRSWFLAQHDSWTGYHGNSVWFIFHLLIIKNFYIYLPKSDISLVKISWTVFEIFSQNAQKSAIFSAVSFWWHYKINMTMTSSKFLVNL